GLFGDLMYGLFHSTVGLSTGAILLFAGQAMQAGHFTVGDFALFVSYQPWVTEFTFHGGILLTRTRQATVSLRRMNALLRGQPPGALVEHRPTYLDGRLPALAYSPRDDGHQLELLEVRGLTCRHPESGHGIEG